MEDARRGIAPLMAAVGMALDYTQANAARTAFQLSRPR